MNLKHNCQTILYPGFQSATKIIGRLLPPEPCISLVVLVFLLIFSSCGGYDSRSPLLQCLFYGPDPAHPCSNPPLMPESWLSGKRLGYRSILDRSGNLVESAVVHRICLPPASRSSINDRWKCSDEIDYSFHPGHETIQTEWMLQYGDQNELSVSLESENEKIKGKAFFSLMILKGRKRIPGQSHKSASVEIRIMSLSGASRPVLDVEEFTMLGLSIGSVKTFWLEEAR